MLVYPWSRSDTSLGTGMVPQMAWVYVVHGNLGRSESRLGLSFAMLPKHFRNINAFFFPTGPPVRRRS